MLRDIHVFVVLSTAKEERDVSKDRHISSQLQQFNFKICINILLYNLFEKDFSL